MICIRNFRASMGQVWSFHYSLLLQAR